MQLEKKTSKADRNNMSPANKLTELMKTNFGHGSFMLALSYL